MKNFFKQVLMDMSFLSLCCMALLLSSCDEHRDFPDTSTKVCDILCTDGKVVTQSQFDKGGKEAIAVVYYINHSDDVAGQGYAVYLWDSEPAAFADSAKKEYMELQGKFIARKENHFGLNKFTDFYKRGIFLGNPSLKSVKFKDTVESIKAFVTDKKNRQER